MRDMHPFTSFKIYESSYHLYYALNNNVHVSL